MTPTGAEFVPAIAPVPGAAPVSAPAAAPVPGAAPVSAPAVGHRRRLRRERRRVAAEGRGVATAAALLALAVLLPVGLLLLSVFTPPTEALRALARGTRITHAVMNTIALCLSVSATTLFFGSTTAWILTRYRLGAERLLILLLILPLTIPAYIHAYSLPAFTITIPPFLVAWYVLTFSLTPYVFLISRIAFQREARVLFDAAQLQGARRPFIRLALPMARPALIGAITLVSMEVMNEYGVFAYLGVETITTIVFRLWLGHYDIVGAAQLASYLLLAIVVGAAIERRSRSAIVYTQHHSALHHHTRTAIRSRWRRTLLHGYCVLPVCCGVALPVGSLIYALMRTMSGGVATAGWWREVLRVTLHSIAIAAAAALICVVAGLLLAYGRQIGHRNQRRWVARLASGAGYGYAIPGAIIAVAVLRLAGQGVAVLGLMLLLFAYMVRYLAVCYHPLYGALTQQCVCTDEVAQSLGVGHWRRLWRITLPQLQRPLGAVLILIIFDVLKDLPLTIILRPIGLETLALQSFYYASEEQFGHAAPFALMLCLIGVVVVSGAQRWRRLPTTTTTTHS